MLLDHVCCIGGCRACKVQQAYYTAEVYEPEEYARG